MQGIGLIDVQRSLELSLRCHEKRRVAWTRREDGQILPGPTAASGSALLYLFQSAAARMLGYSRALRSDTLVTHSVSEAGRPSETSPLDNPARTTASDAKSKGGSTSGRTTESVP